MFLFRPTPLLTFLQRTCQYPESLLPCVVLHALSFIASITSKLSVRSAISWDGIVQYLLSKPIPEEEDGKVTTTTKMKLSTVPGASSIYPHHMHLFQAKCTLCCVIVTLVVRGGLYAPIVGSHQM